MADSIQKTNIPDINAYQQRLATLNQSRTENATKISKNTNDITQNKEHTESNNQDISNNNSAISENTSAQTETTEIINNIDGQISSINGQISNTNDAINDLKSTLNSSKDEVERDKVSDKISENEVKLADLENELKKFEDDKTTNEQKLAKQKEEGVELEKKAQSFAQKDSDLKSEFQVFSNEKEDLNTEKTQIDLEIAELEKSIEEAKAQSITEGDLVKKAENLYKNGVTFNDNLSLSLKKGKLNYSVDNVNAFANLNGVGMSYEKGDFSINGKVNYSGRYSLNGAYNDEMLSASLGYGQKGVNAGITFNTYDNKFGIGTGINGNNWDANLYYKPSKNVNINAKGNKHGVSVNITHTF